MKVKDNGIFEGTKENLNMDISPKETEDKTDKTEKDLEKSDEIKNKKSEEEKIIKTIYENDKMKENKMNKINEKENNKEIKEDKNQMNIKNCINKIDLDNNLIVLNKKNLKEINVINKENTKKNKISQKKGEIINIYGNNKFYYTNKDIANTINKSYDIYNKKINNSYENSGKIQYNMKFPNDVIEKFFERKKSKKKENKDNNNYINSFGCNPLERLKEIQEKLNDAPPVSKNNKITVKKFKTSQKKLKEEDYKIQNYIKLFPVFNTIEGKIFKSNQFYYYNRIYDDKNNYYIKKKKISNGKNKMSEEIEKEKDESEEDTIDRHNKKKFINKKRNKSKNKENKNQCEV